MRKLISIVLIFSFIIQLFTQSLYAQYLPNLSAGVSAITKSSLLPPNLALLRYVAVNPANPFNYFNFLVDKPESPQKMRGQEDVMDYRPSTIDLNQEAKRLIQYFFTGLTVTEQSLWVNLQPQQSDKMISDELANTDMGRVLLEQDLQLKKDMARYLHPKVYEGQLFWRKLDEAVNSSQLTDDRKNKNTVNRQQSAVNQFDVPYRVWIVPDSAKVVETEDGALVTDAKLKVMLEVEYLAQKTEDRKQNTENPSSDISKQLMKEIIIPKITKDVNENPKYAPLRQIYYSLVLAEWYKIRHSKDGSAYAGVINKGWTKGLEADLPWSKQKIWQEYQNSYQKGEYETQANILGIGIRKFFSGGFSLPPAMGTVSKITPSGEIVKEYYDAAGNELSDTALRSSPVTFNIDITPLDYKKLSGSSSDSTTYSDSDSTYASRYFSAASPVIAKTPKVISDEGMGEFNIASTSRQSSPATKGKLVAAFTGLMALGDWISANFASAAEYSYDATTGVLKSFKLSQGETFGKDVVLDIVHKYNLSGMKFWGTEGRVFGFFKQVFPSANYADMGRISDGGKILRAGEVYVNNIVQNTQGPVDQTINLIKSHGFSGSPGPNLLSSHTAHSILSPDSGILRWITESSGYQYLANHPEILWTAAVIGAAGLAYWYYNKYKKSEISQSQSPASPSGEPGRVSPAPHSDTDVSGNASDEEPYFLETKKSSPKKEQGPPLTIGTEVELVPTVILEKEEAKEESVPVNGGKLSYKSPPVPGKRMPITYHTLRSFMEGDSDEDIIFDSSVAMESNTGSRDAKDLRNEVNVFGVSPI